MEIMTAKEVADLMRVSPAHIRRLAAEDRLPFSVIRFGTRYRFPANEVMKYINGGNDGNRS